MISEWLKDTQERLLAPIKTWMRLVMLLILLFWLSWFFTDFQIYTLFFSLLMPFCYLFKGHYYLTKNVSILIIVIIINIAFWIPNYYSYLFIKALMFVERIKLFFVIAFNTLLLPIVLIIGYHDNKILITSVILITMWLVFYINSKILEALNADEIRQQFKVDHMSKDDEKWLIRKIGVTFVLAICAMYYF